MSWPQTAHRFFGRRDIGAMTDDGHHGEGEHDQRNVTVPAMPGAGFVVIETEFVLGGFEADVVVGVWPDRTRPLGVDCLIIKGTQRLREFLADRKNPPVFDAIKCIEAEQAEAARQVFGEVDRLQ